MEERVQATLDALEPVLDEDNLVGLVAAIDGRILSAELYGQNRLFKASSRDMLRALSLDALSRDPAESSSQSVEISVVQGFLQEAVTSPITGETGAGLGRLSRRISSQMQSFETKGENGNLIHLNVYAH